MKPDAITKHVSGWPGVTRDVKWGEDLVFSVDGKMFCVIHASGTDGAAFKVGAEHFLAWTDREGVMPAPYMARAHWVKLAKPNTLPAADMKAAIRRSYELVAAKLSKKRQRELGLLD